MKLCFQLVFGTPIVHSLLLSMDVKKEITQKNHMEKIDTSVVSQVFFCGDTLGTADGFA